MMCNYYTITQSIVGRCMGMKNMPIVECDGCLGDCENEHMIQKLKKQAKECAIYDVKIKRSDLTITEKTIVVPDDELIFEFSELVDELQFNNATEINIKKR